MNIVLSLKRRFAEMDLHFDPANTWKIKQVKLLVHVQIRFYLPLLNTAFHYHVKVGCY